MKTLVVPAILLLLFAILIPLSAEDDKEVVAIALKVKGRVDWNHDGTVKPLEKGQELYNGDKLVSHEDAYAAIRFVDGYSLLKLFPGSTLVIDSEKRGENLKKKSMLRKGSVFSQIQKKMGEFEIETPTTIASVKGTRFLTMVQGNGNTNLMVFSGIVSLKNISDETMVYVRAGQMAYATGSGPIVVTDLDMQQLDPEMTDMIEEQVEPEVLEIELRGPDGDTRTIRIEFE